MYRTWTIIPSISKAKAKRGLGGLHAYAVVLYIPAEARAGPPPDEMSTSASIFKVFLFFSKLISLRDARRGTSRLKTVQFGRFQVKWTPGANRGGYPESNG